MSLGDDGVSYGDRNTGIVFAGLYLTSENLAADVPRHYVQAFLTAKACVFWARWARLAWNALGSSSRAHVDGGPRRCSR
ncbi:hypothetical protein [Paracoccus mutanolyticus]|uniref:hypothetical protein n=1 Tax=Paracoccus mutanolyticus TaxID=1499308 RepID=UPI0016758A83|nr:hypothetical protein [Paracoccus mutanolyticus]